MFTERIKAVLTLGALFVLLNVCDALPTEVDKTVPFTLLVSLRNDSGRDAQILRPNEQPNPALVLVSRQSREINVGYVKDGDVLKFRALIFEESIGGAWLEVADQACVYDAKRSGAQIVAYKGGIALACENW